VVEEQVVEITLQQDQVEDLEELVVAEILVVEGLLVVQLQLTQVVAAVAAVVALVDLVELVDLV
tara:strand:- start:15 stop:206 length:192 start_codon:yes stop_codon:yes gene_type:complete